ncbi:MAG: branched-chain amino acid ABC transporter permease, partial [Deltaproteobacteria bacterium]|nr:branched-chain amino acid ABC transporter permease [Deltaproteobacteria bacterium]
MDATTAMYVAQGIHGLAYGMVLFLVASGLTLIFGMMGILNIAHAAFFMLSAYFCYQVMAWTGNFWLGLLVAPIAAAVLGVLVERFLLRKVHAFGLIGELILTMGIMLV